MHPLLNNLLPLALLRRASLLGLGLAAMFSWTSNYLEAATREPAIFEGEIHAFEQRDQANPPAPGAILFVGSSSIRFWTNLPSAFAGYRVLNRGFGGSFSSDVNYFFDRVVGKYKPSRIVYYEGDNDIAAGVTPEKVAADFREFTRKVADRVGTVPIAYIAIKPSPSRLAMQHQQIEANRLVREFIGTQTNLAFIDVWPAMMDSKNVPRDELFLADKLHMNGNGYAIWRELVLKWLAATDPVPASRRQ